MKPQIRILETAGNALKLDFVWSKGDNTFELPENSLTEKTGEFNYFWYFSDGTYSLDPKAQPIFNNTTNQVYESGLLMFKKKKKGPIVRGKASPTPRPPVDPYDRATLYVHVEASSEDSSRGLTNKNLEKDISPENILPTEVETAPVTPTNGNTQNSTIIDGAPVETVPVKPGIEPTPSALQLESVVLENMMIAVIKYTRLDEMDADGYLRISINRRASAFPPLLMQQKPIIFNDEWVDLSSPAEDYLQAIQIGFKDMEVGKTRAFFIPFWALYTEDATTGATDINLANELQVEWLKIDETGEELIIQEAHTVLLEATAEPVSQ